MTGHTTTYHTAHIWEAGHRPSNEDSLAIIDVMSGRQHIFMAVVADGIGGLNMGGYASAYVTGQLRDSLKDYLKRHGHVSLKNMGRLILRTLYNCHTYLLNYGSRHAIHTGTTVSILCFIGRRGITLQVGDSHLYRIGRRIRQIGHDHIDSNGHLTECIGSGKYHRKSIIKLRINKNDTMILCSDGFYRLGASMFKGFEVWHHNSSKSISDELHDRLTYISEYAYRHGEHDNMSAIAVKVS